MRPHHLLKRQGELQADRAKPASSPLGWRDSTEESGSGTHPDEPDGTVGKQGGGKKGPPHLKPSWVVGDVPT